MIDIGPFAALVPADHGLAVIAIALPDGSGARVRSKCWRAGPSADRCDDRRPGRRRPGPQGCDFCGPIRELPSRCAPAGNGRPSTDRSNWSVRTTQSPGIDADRLQLLLREIFTAAGGTHDDWDTYDRVMAAERRHGRVDHSGTALHQPVTDRAEQQTVRSATPPRGSGRAPRRRRRIERSARRGESRREPAPRRLFGYGSRRIHVAEPRGSDARPTLSCLRNQRLDSARFRCALVGLPSPNSLPCGSVQVTNQPILGTGIASVAFRRAR